MNRDELAFQILLKILESHELRASIISGYVDRAQRDEKYVYNPSAAYAQVAFRQADEFIAAGITDEMRQRAAEFNVKLPPGSDSGWRA